ncbi:LCP family protein [Lactobacillus psittaci]|uniref:Transcriptional regulator n=1 Tax=Lactobacillus psittaci DSM 15354 TaxID=1122152 RepID=A0A0R1SAV9_9LACO|nr:LCP family protein [Lactobacillus psittaci]KRL63267.1 transcriptional regulator [Lactobacillus psittaci DSM 15354]
MDNNHPSNSRVELHQADYRQKRRLWRKLLLLTIVIVLGALAYFGYVYLRTKGAIDQTYDNKNAVSTKSSTFDGKKKFAVLLLGTDTGAFDRTEKMGNTDTIIVAVVNPAKKKYTLMSIPRDTLAEMVGTKKFTAEKINAAYSIGGAKMAMKSVSVLINVPIKYYAVVNMGGLRKMVNGVGGVVVKPPLSFTYGGYSFKKGQKTKLNGSQALAYARMRYDDPQGDYGRQLRQRQVIISMIQHAASIKTLVNLESILNSVSNNIRTNLSFNNLMAIFQNYRSSTKNSDSDYLHGTGVYIDEASYQVMSDKELQRVSNILRSELGLEKETISNNETYQNKRNEENGFSYSSTSNQNYTIYSYNKSSSDSNDDSGED